MKIKKIALLDQKNNELIVRKIIRRVHHSPLRKFLNRKYLEYRQGTWYDRPLPSCLFIGAQKSGTSSLDHFLIQHPQIEYSPLKHEVHFFDDTSNYEKGEPFYRAHFPQKRAINANSIILDSTPSYIFHPLAAERIFRMLPNVKLIALLRNPADRAISHYFMNWRKNYESLPILDAFQKEKERLGGMIEKQDYYLKPYFRYSYLSRGHYAEQIERYLRVFPAEQILLLSSEDFFSEPAKHLRHVFDFIGVDAETEIKDLAPQNVGENKSPIDADVYEYLNEYFRQPNHALYNLTGIKFNW